jgi:hypothetical protein
MQNKFAYHLEQKNQESEHIRITFKTTYYYIQNNFAYHLEQTNEVSETVITRSYYSQN